MLEAETGTAGGVDFDDAGDAERIRIGAGGFGQRSRCDDAGAAAGPSSGRRRRGLSGSAGGAVAALGAAVCDHALPDTHSETAPAKIKPAAKRILFPLR